ncbi:MAG: U32 family peptidase [Thermodesulfobacteriota bacterium]|nr:MAG: U32 family peptidase [Thermodesulfobacteriota bacterium]
MELTLGPVLYEWSRDALFNFYREVSETSVDRVYLGEVLCSKKRALKPEDIPAIAEMLEKAGKKVVLSSLAVISNEDELEFTRRLLKLPYAVEANDMSVLNMADPKEREVFAGPHITTYNVPSIEFLQSTGIKRVTFPVELSRDSIAYNIRNTGIEGEVFSHGRLPLAFSWRCYTARASGLTKSECRRNCKDEPDGILIKTMEGSPLFTLSGTSVLSADAYTLAGFVEDLRAIGVKGLRISPQYNDTGKIIGIFRKRLEGSLGADEAVAELRLLSGGRLCNGWYAGAAGKDFFERVPEEAAGTN